MTSTVFNVEATMEDGTVFKTTGDQRDIAWFETEPYGLPFYQMRARPFTFLRYLAWRAGKRDKLHQFQTFEAFSDACVSARNLDQLDGAEAPAGDPGSPAPSAEN